MHGGWIDEHGHGRKAASQRDQHVAQRGARRRRDDADSARQLGDRALARGVEQTFRGELALQLLEPAPERAFAGFLGVIDDELELPASLVDAGPRAHEHLEAVRELEA